jgi:cyanate permease
MIAAAGPLMVGALRDITGGFQSSVLLLVAIAACMMLIALRLKPSAVQAPSAA